MKGRSDDRPFSCPERAGGGTGSNADRISMPTGKFVSGSGHDWSMTITAPPDALATLLSQPVVPQAAFPWTKQPWLDQMQDLPEVLSMLDGLPEKVDRDAVRGVVSREMADGRVLPAFIATMVWGWGTTAGLGALRTRWILTQTHGKDANAADEQVDPVVEIRLAESAKRMQDGGAVEGFRYLNNEGGLRHLGASYFTKWLYFTSAVDGAYGKDAAPILDDRILGWLKQSAGIELKKSSTPAYQEYVALLSAWGSLFDRTPVEVEAEIFRLTTGRG